MKKLLGLLEFISVTIECFLFLWLAIGLWACVNKINKLEEQQDRLVMTNSIIESSANKFYLIAMRCQKMEQDNDMLRLRIEELEDTFAAITNKDSSACGQYYIYTSMHTEDSQQKEAYNPLAVDDLVPLTEE